MNDLATELPTSRRPDWLAVVATLIGFVIVYCVLWPRMITVTDENTYLRTATTYASGRLIEPHVDVLTGNVIYEQTARYAPGLPLLMTPFVKALGWRGAYAIPLTSAVIAVLALAAWLDRCERSPLWALLLLTYLPFTALARVGMSDVPSAAAAALAFGLMWRRGRAAWGACGLICGLSVLLRETNAVLFASFIVGIAVRYRVKAWPLMAGLLAGGVVSIVLVRLLVGAVTGRASESIWFSLHNLPVNLPHYVLPLLVLLPGGLIAAALYRGQWAAELKSSVVIFLLLFGCWWYNGTESGFGKALVLGAGRFMIPLAPLIIFAIADVVTRRWQTFTLSPRLTNVIRLAPAAIALVVIVETSAVQWVMARWAGTQAEVVRAIRTPLPRGTVLFTNLVATNKALSPAFDSQYGPVVSVDYLNLSVADVQKVLGRGIRPWVAMLYRDDSPMLKPQNSIARDWVRKITDDFEIRTVVDGQLSPADHLQIFEIDGNKH